MNPIRPVLARAQGGQRLRGRLREVVRGTQAWGRGYVPGRPGTLPGAVIIGAQRCGTTSLYSYLAAHPDVLTPLVKEIQYFSVKYGRGPRWYRGNFPAAATGQLTIEASPYYLFDPAVPARLAGDLPGSKVLVLLRDPVERAYSHYLHSRALGVESLSFADALAAEDTRLAAVAGPDPSRADHQVRRNVSYVARGRYAEQLTRWLAVFPREDLLVLRSEDMYADAERVHQQVLAHLGLPEHRLPTYRRYTRRSGTDSGELTPTLRAQIRDRLADDEQALVRLLGWERGWA